MVFDIDNVQTGWLLLGVGVREWQGDAQLGRKGPQPTPEFKRGFIVKFYNKELGTVEWSSNGVGPNMGLEQMYTACAAQHAANPGKMPVLEYTGSKLEKIGKGTTRIPAFNLVSWIDKPAGMDQSDAEFVAQAAATAAVTAPAPFVAPVAKPTPAAAAVAASDDEMF